MTSFQSQVRITAVRSRGEFGGAIVSAVTDDQVPFSVVIPYKVLNDSSLIQKGQRWNVTGSVEKVTWRRGSFLINESQVTATDAMLLQPSGENVIHYIAENPDFSGIGRVKAQRLWQRFGDRLFDLIRERDLETLSQVVTQEAAKTLCAGFSKIKLAESLLYLDKIGVPRRIGQKVVGYYGEETLDKVHADPYRLLAFETDWSLVDDLAVSRVGILHDSSQRLHSAIEESLYRAFDDSHTCIPANSLRIRLTSLLKDKWLVDKALSIGLTNGQYYLQGETYHPAGAYLMEQFISRRIATMGDRAQVPTQASLSGNSDIEVAIQEYEGVSSIELTSEQKQAIRISATARLSLILGGAGVGKTTVLKGIYHALNARNPFTQIYQMALSGRAAKRMTETTDRPSYTIAGFLRNIPSSDIPEDSVIVIDEASMVDVILMYRLLRHLPSTARMVLVGDPSQLPPVGPGLTLHAFVDSNIPKTELKVVKRQSAASGIPQVSATIREHRWPFFHEFTSETRSGVSFVPCRPCELEHKTIEIYELLGGNGSTFDTQILSATRSGYGGVDNINIALHDRYRKDDRPIRYKDEEFGNVTFRVSGGQQLRVNDLVMFTANDYERDLRNGTLGQVVEAFDVQTSEEVCCQVNFEGQIHHLSYQDLEKIDLAYAISIHKSQGSQFKRVVIPVRHSRLLDQTLLYTAVTRGVDQVVLVGDFDAAKKAIEQPPKALKRNIGLRDMLIARLGRCDQALRQLA